MNEIDRVIQELRKGNVVSFPTETVYALACDATNDNAVQKIFQLKQRDFSKPLSVFFKNVAEAKKYMIFDKRAELLANKFMPGELTLILKQRKDSDLSKYVSFNNNTLGFRIPNHKMCQEILGKFNKPIVATSANISGNPASLSSRDVRKYFKNEVYVIKNNEGAKSSNKASTIIDLTEEKVGFVREGVINFSEIKKLINKF